MEKNIRILIYFSVRYKLMISKNFPYVFYPPYFSEELKIIFKKKRLVISNRVISNTGQGQEIATHNIFPSTKERQPGLLPAAF